MIKNTIDFLTQTEKGFKDPNRFLTKTQKGLIKPEKINRKIF